MVFQLNRPSYWMLRRCGSLVKSTLLVNSSKFPKYSSKVGASSDKVANSNPLAVKWLLISRSCFTISGMKLPCGVGKLIPSQQHKRQFHHSLCHRILRFDSQLQSLPERFHIQLAQTDFESGSRDPKNAMTCNVSC